MHRLAHRNRVWNDLVGWFAGIPLTVTRPAFRYVHLAHHAKTNQADEDPTSWWVGARCGTGR